MSDTPKKKEKRECWLCGEETNYTGPNRDAKCAKCEEADTKFDHVWRY